MFPMLLLNVIFMYLLVTQLVPKGRYSLLIFIVLVYTSILLLYFLLPQLYALLLLLLQQLRQLLHTYQLLLHQQYCTITSTYQLLILLYLVPQPLCLSLALS